MAGTVLKRVHPPSRRHPNGLVRWRAVLPLEPGPSGERRMRREDFPTKRDAQDALAQWRVEQRQGLLVERSDQTVAQMMAYWLETHAATKKPRTVANYTDATRWYILPFIGTLKIQDLQPKHIVAWHATLRKAGKSPHAIGLAHQRLSQALDQAETLGLVPRNVAAKVKPPQQEQRPERPTWTVPQARAFLATARAHCGYGPIFRVALATGMRRGELLGLRWADIDWQAGLLHIRQSIGPVQHTMTPGTPKTRRSQRTVAVATDLLDALKEHRRQQNEQRLRVGPVWQDADLVFASEVGTPIGDSNLHREYHRLVALAGVPYITIHDQRHTVASWAIAGGVDPKTTAERLGQHVSMTLERYTHTSTRQHRVAAEILDTLLAGDPNGEEEKGAL